MPFIESKTPLLGSLSVLMIKAVLCVPDLAFPINSQVPPVALALLPYTFEFSATTFVSNSPQISYTLSGGPEWLKIDTANRRLSGTPRSIDVGATSFQLTASDVTGDATDSVTLVVSESNDLAVQEPIKEHLLDLGSFSGPHSLLLRPSQPFAFKFDGNLFSGTTAATRYYAISADNTPLPSWLQFDAVELLFSGDTPPLISTTPPAQEFRFRLIASNVPGFAEAIAEFNIVIQFHILAFSTPSHSAALSTGEFWRTESLRDSLMLDGQPIGDDQILSVTVDGPPWVQLDEGQISLRGRPKTQANTTITISVTDVFHNVANATWFLVFMDLPVSQLGVVADIEASAGEYLVCTLDIRNLYPSMWFDPGPGNDLSWLNYNATNLTLYGEVPLHLSPAVWNISVSFQSMTMNATGILILRLVTSVKPTATTPIIDGTDLPRNPSASIGATATSSTTTNPHTSKGDWRPTVLAICLSVVGAVVVALICVLLWLRRRRSRGKGDKNIMSIIEHAEPVRSNPPLRPPRIDLAWSNDSLQKANSRVSGSKPLEQQQMPRLCNSDLDKAEARNLRTSIHAQSMKGKEASSMREWQPFRAQETILASPSRTANSQRRMSDARAMGKALRNSIIHPSVGLPHRRSGAGHGAGIISDAGIDHSRRDTRTSSPLGEKHRSTVLLDSFPIPPSAPACTTARATSPSGAMFDAIEDSLSFEAQRQRWHTERARTRLEGAARFSNRGSSRLFSPSRSHCEKSNFEATDTSIMNQKGGGSIASSRQFDSVASSGSQWEDESPSKRQDKVGPRLPFSPLTQSQENMCNGDTSTTLRQGRVADQRTMVNVETSGLTRTQSSQHASLRYI
ncbi:uncharacterized protein A1O9_02817 [Exophiala aquamarina CBS 119918]|uniref:Dystroglycan-type cadherin-like domain-containing protein n=1 Tax=Exophiala aquamarina CBS 119918 TaxID=1182545 RepID=A0A072PND8_9EURO|nr:uncharacterized protein A1O9_02817 [Exophiala aquamarina CBS 119918]KEF61252.1 hypothetical protein A1O9_02817 [Exophiala aquamarina CBS 119918]